MNPTSRYQAILDRLKGEKCCEQCHPTEAEAWRHGSEILCERAAKEQRERHERAKGQR
jgi:hypothetical protein